MKRRVLTTVILATTLSMGGVAAEPVLTFTKVWTFAHGTDLDGLPAGQVSPPGQVSEIPAFDSRTNTIWVVGIVGVDVLSADTGSLVKHIDVSSWGSVNSVAIHNGVAAFAVEAGPTPAPGRARPGRVLFFDTKTRALSDGINNVPVGALPDMLTFTHDGSKLLVANEGTPCVGPLPASCFYGGRIGTTVPRNFASPAGDPAGSVTIIDMETRTVAATAGFTGIVPEGSNVRTNTGMDFEPEYIAINKDGTEAYVTLQEGNAIGVLDLTTNSFTKVIGLGVKDFNAAGNEIDPRSEVSATPPSPALVDFISVGVKGLYMPDGIATYQWHDETYLVMANEGDFREDDGDRRAASQTDLGPAATPLDTLRVSSADSSPGNLYAAGARSFSIRGKTGNLIYDSGSILDKAAAGLVPTSTVTVATSIYDDGRSRDKGVEPEGLALMDIGGRTYAFIGLERTLKSAVAIFDITNPEEVSFLDLIVTAGDLAPEGLNAYKHQGEYYLAIANETPPSGGTSNTTLYRLNRVK